MNEPPADWYIATLLDAAADALEGVPVRRRDPVDLVALANLTARLRLTARDLRKVDAS